MQERNDRLERKPKEKRKMKTLTKIINGRPVFITSGTEARLRMLVKLALATNMNQVYEII